MILLNEVSPLKQPTSEFLSTELRILQCDDRFLELKHPEACRHQLPRQLTVKASISQTHEFVLSHNKHNLK